MASPLACKIASHIYQYLVMDFFSFAGAFLFRVALVREVWRERSVLSDGPERRKFPISVRDVCRWSLSHNKMPLLLAI